MAALCALPWALYPSQFPALKLQEHPSSEVLTHLWNTSSGPGAQWAPCAPTQLAVPWEQAASPGLACCLPSSSLQTEYYIKSLDKVKKQIRETIRKNRKGALSLGQKTEYLDISRVFISEQTVKARVLSSVRRSALVNKVLLPCNLCTWIFNTKVNDSAFLKRDLISGTLLNWSPLCQSSPKDCCLDLVTESFCRAPRFICQCLSFLPSPKQHNHFKLPL